MNWKPIKKAENGLSIVNCTLLAKHDEEKCKYCGRYGCTDRGYTVATSDPAATLCESALAQQVMDNLKETIDKSWLGEHVRWFRCEVGDCVRKLKRSNAETVLERLHACNEDCHRNSDPCPFRGEESVCQRNVNPNGSPLVCSPDDENYFDCPFHEMSFSHCYRRHDGQCDDLMEKFDATGKKDILFLLSHRFSAAPCRFCKDGTCQNEASLHNEGFCTLQGLMAPCEQYAPIGSDSAYTEGVCTYVSSKDGKDDCKVFPSSEYARNLSYLERFTLCAACRLSHGIAKATGLKCLGVRRTTSNPFLNKKNPLADYAIQINYLFMTNPGDTAKFDPELISRAVYGSLEFDCEAIQCEEYQTCKLYM